MCFSTQRQPRGRETYSKHLVDPTVQISPLQITNGNTMIFARKAFGLGKLGVKCCIIRKRKCLHVV